MQIVLQWKIISFLNKRFIEEAYKSYLIQAQQLAIDAARSASATCASLPETGTRLVVILTHIIIKDVLTILFIPVLIVRLLKLKK
jgi:hypothetical protein